MQSSATEYRLALRFGGIVAVILISATVALAWHASRRASALVIYADFPRVFHLNPGASVRVLGVPAGRVESVELLPLGQAEGLSGAVRLQLRLDHSFAPFLGRDAVAGFAQSSPLAEPHITVEPGDPDSPRVAPGDVLMGIAPTTTRALLATAAEARAASRPWIEAARHARELVRARGQSALLHARELVGEGRQGVADLQPHVAVLREQVAELSAIDLDVDAVRSEVRKASGLLRASSRTMKAAFEDGQRRLDETMDDVTHTLGVYRVVFRRLESPFTGIQQELPELAREVAQRVRSALTDRRYSLAAFAADEEIQNDIKGVQMTLKRRFWRFVFDAGECPPAP